MRLGKANSFQPRARRRRPDLVTANYTDRRRQNAGDSCWRQSDDDGRETENRYLDNRRHITSAHTKSMQCRPPANHCRGAIIDVDTRPSVASMSSETARGAGRPDRHQTQQRRIQRYTRSDKRGRIATRPATNPLKDVSVGAAAYCYADAADEIDNLCSIWETRQPVGWMPIPLSTSMPPAGSLPGPRPAEPRLSHNWPSCTAFTFIWSS